MTPGTAITGSSLYTDFTIDGQRFLTSPVKAIIRFPGIVIIFFFLMLQELASLPRKGIFLFTIYWNLI
jgi:hypothetical protein